MLPQCKLLGIILFILMGAGPALYADTLDQTFDRRVQTAAEEKEVKILPISRKQALLMAEQLDVVKSLYDLRGGLLSSCIEKEVVTPCESEWVTCIEDAWVVKFVVGKMCPIEHDGRLNVTVLIDGNDGKVISRYPEVDYFKDNYFCRDQADCIQTDIKDKNNQVMDQRCANFIHAQSQFSYAQKDELSNSTLSPEAITAQLKERSQNCVCREHRCENVLAK